jgi:hypothetical protein
MPRFSREYPVVWSSDESGKLNDGTDAEQWSALSFESYARYLGIRFSGPPADGYDDRRLCTGEELLPASTTIQPGLLQRPSPAGERLFVEAFAECAETD